MWDRNLRNIREWGIVIWAYRVHRVAECREREVRRRDIKSIFLAVKPFGGMSVASWSIIEPGDVRKWFHKLSTEYYH
jgi:hypothetical protein